MTDEPNGIEGRPRRPAPRPGKFRGRWRGASATERADLPSEDGWPAGVAPAGWQAALRLRAVDRAIAELAGQPLLN